MKKLFTFIGKIASWIWKTISFTRQLLLNIIFIAFILGIYYFVTIEHPLESTKKGEVSKKALLVNISGPIVEKAQKIEPYDLISRNLIGQSIQFENILFDIVNQIRAAAKDDNINGMVLNLTDMSETSLTKLRYIAKAIEEFKETGKEVIAVGGHYSQSQYYLSSYANKIFMPPDGAVLLQGYGSYHLYLKDLLDKFDINTHVFRVGTYKSFVEPYTRTNMSEQAREANFVWLNQLWDAYISDVSKNREISTAALSPKAQGLLDAVKAVKGDLAQFALKLRLVDALLTRPQIQKILAEKFGVDDENGFKYVSIYDYKSHKNKLPKPNQIGVVVVSGTIIDGAETEGTAGGNTIAALLRQARLDDEIKAVILRVDTPGGSAFASEVIRTEVQALKDANKPVVVSMSSIAASGGYWISTSADRIIAQPTTITGSIGVFGILTTFEKTLAKYGVYNDGIGTTPLSGVGFTRALPDEVADIMQLGVENSYHRFIDLVSSQRNIPIDKVEKVAQGRVWTGLDAMEHGLVDQMGDFDDAITSAATLAKLEDYSLNWMEEPMTATQQLVYDLIHNVMTQFEPINYAVKPNPSIKFLTENALNEFNKLNQLNDPIGQYAICPSCNYFQH